MWTGVAKLSTKIVILTCPRHRQGWEYLSTHSQPTPNNLPVFNFIKMKFIKVSICRLQLCVQLNSKFSGWLFFSSVNIYILCFTFCVSGTLFCFFKALSFYMMPFDFFITANKFKSTTPYLKPLGKMCFRIQNFGFLKGIQGPYALTHTPGKVWGSPLIIKHSNISVVKGINIPTKWDE